MRLVSTVGASRPLRLHVGTRKPNCRSRASAPDAGGIVSCPREALEQRTAERLAAREAEARDSKTRHAKGVGSEARGMSSAEFCSPPC